MSYPPPVPKPPPGEWQKWVPRPKVIAGLLTLLAAALVVVALRALGVDLPDLDLLGGMLTGGALFGGAAYVKGE